MSFTVRMLEGRYTPLALCDACGQRITDPAMAVVAYDMQGEGDRTPQLAHKGRCHDALDGRIRAAGGFPGWNGFDRWMADLLFNAGLQGNALARALEASEHFHEVGL